MKTILFYCRTLAIMMVAGTLLMSKDALGQTDGNGTNCSTIQANGDCSYAIGSGAEANGNHSIAIGIGSKGGTLSTGTGNDYGFGFGSAAYAEAENSVAIGVGVGTGSSNEYNLIIGNKGASNFTNTIDYSIMLGTKLSGSVPTLYLEDPDLSTQAWGNVGVGTVSPASRLHVYDEARVGVGSTANGSLVFNGSTNSNIVRINSGVTSTSYDLYLPTSIGSNGDVLGLVNTAGQLGWVTPSTTNNSWLIAGNSGTSATTNFLGTIDNEDLVIRTFNTEKVRVKSGGNVGIGTSSPNSILHLKDGAGDDTELILDQNGSAEANVRFNVGGTTEAARIGINANGGSSSNHIFYENLTNDLDQIFRVTVSNTLTEAMRIDGTTGWVGIGAPVPGAPLNVRDQIDSGAEELARFNVSDAGGDWLQIRNGDDADGEFWPEIFGDVENHNGHALRLVASTDNTNDTGAQPLMLFVSRIQGNPPPQVSVRPLFQWRNSTNTVMHLAADGSLGIGTTSPQGRLEVAGTAFVNTLPVAGGTPIGYDANNRLVDISGSSLYFKENIDDLEFNSEQFLSMRPVSFSWKEAYGGGEDVGFIAQEVAQDFPPLADIRFKHTYFPDGSVLRDSLGLPVLDSSQTEPYGVKYHKLPVYLYMLAKKQDSAITVLTNRLDELQSMLETCCAQPAYRLAESPTEALNAQKSEGNEFVLMQNDPNPFSDYTDIRMSVPESAKNVSLLIVDMKGVVMLNTPISGTSETVRVYSSDIGKGIFTYYLLSEGNVIASRKMVSSK